ncbi:MAG: aspartate/glutamate racemase family protein [Deltaproteobacteria bacterium]|jgi:hypothetical protein|nr:aspartate/glutamate racemase family protein [Deltaproteobacteria bacterium]
MEEMEEYVARSGADSYGHAVGIILIDSPTPFIPGDVGNASSFKYPVLYRTVEGVTVDRLINRFDPGNAGAVVRTAKDLAAHGVRLVTSDCGFMLRFQKEVATALKVPVALSSLSQLPFIESTLGRGDRVGVITANGEKFDRELLTLAGMRNPDAALVRGMEGCPGFKGPALENTLRLKPGPIRGHAVSLAREMVAGEPQIRAILLECSMLPPYAAAIQRAVGLPVFDFITMIDCLVGASFRKDFTGFY